MNKKQFLKAAMNSPVQVDDFYSYKIVKMNEEEVEMSEQFKKKLIKENLYDNSYVGIFVFAQMEDAIVKMESLPIFEKRKGFDTKHLKLSKEQVIKGDLTDKDLELLKRTNEFQDSLQMQFNLEGITEL